MEKMVLDDFIKYAKEQFGCDLMVQSCDVPDTFERVFGASFLNDKSSLSQRDGFDYSLSYENVSLDVQLTDHGTNNIYNSFDGLAA